MMVLNPRTSKWLDLPQIADDVRNKKMALNISFFLEEINSEIVAKIHADQVY